MSAQATPKACAHCGHVGIRQVPGAEIEDLPRGVAIMCEGCSLVTPVCETYAEALVIWNRRAPDPRPAPCPHHVVCYDDSAGNWYCKKCRAWTPEPRHCEDPGASAMPMSMILPCPRCRELHVDALEPEKGWTNPPHKSHLCHYCGLVWRPADVPTNGVASIATIGKDDNWKPGEKTIDPALAAAMEQRAQALAELFAIRNAIEPAFDPAMTTAQHVGYIYDEKTRAEARAGEAVMGGPAVRTALGFLASAVKCGEEWSETHERILLTALSEMDEPRPLTTKAERPDARGEARWIACSERMPERMAVVIVMERGGDRPCCAQWFTYKVDGMERISWHQDSEHVEADSGNYGNGANKDHRDLDVTHWMPLPPGPDAAKPGGDGAAEKNGNYIDDSLINRHV